MKTEPVTEPIDPRAVATAYALGELTAEERTAFEQQIENDPELASLAGETKDFCGLLSSSLRQPTVELQQAARSRLLFEADKRTRDARIVRHKWMRRVTAVAACLTAGITGTWWWMHSTGRLDDKRLSASAPPDAFGAVTADQIKEQEAAVEQSRLAMLELMKRHRIVDLVSYSAGEPNSAVVQAGIVQPGSQTTGTAPVTTAPVPARPADSTAAATDYALAKNDYESQVQKLGELRARNHEVADGKILTASAPATGEPVVPLPRNFVPHAGLPSSQVLPNVKDNFSTAQNPAGAFEVTMSAPAAGDGSGGGRGTGMGAGVGSGYGPGAAPAKAKFYAEPGTYAFNTPEVRKSSVGGIYLTEREGTKTRDDSYRSAVLGGQDRSNTESYKPLPENQFRGVLREPLSTFSIDVDTASYSNVRRFLNMGQCPPPEAVRLEELVNYFPYDYAQPVDGKPFAVHVEMTSAPWNQHHRLARIALKGKEVAQGERPAANLVFLVDVSGSMQPENKLPLVKQSLQFVVERLTEKDTVSMVTYAGESGVALPATNGADKARILAAINGLNAGGSTNGAGGITTAYQQAAMHFNKEGINRVILATDGDFNVGVTSHEELLTLITEKAKSGVFLSVLGYGMGNTKDDTMELLADKGNGNYAYIDSLSEARKSLADQFSGTLVTIAKDVKIQIEFNPAIIREYRLLGYENRMLAKEDFNNDKKDAGEIGAGHTVTALYELVPVGAPEPNVMTTDKLKYQPQPEPAPVAPVAAPVANASGETMTVKLRWKAPDADVSQLMEVPVKDAGAKLTEASSETRWAVAVAGFAALLNNSQFAGLSWDDVRVLARGSKGADPNGYRGEFLQLINKAESLRR